MFCTTLRRRPSTAGLVPLLTAVPPSGLDLKERDLHTHDLSLAPKPTISIVNPERHLFLLLTSSATNPNQIPQTLSRIQHFSSLTGGTNCAILLLLTAAPLPNPKKFGLTATGVASSTTSGPSTANPIQETQHPLQPYTTLLSLLLFDNSTSASVPIVLIPTARDLPNILQSYLQQASSAHAYAAPPVPKSGSNLPEGGYDLLPYCSTDERLSMEEVVALSDEFVDMRDLVQGAMAGVGEDRRLEDALGDEKAAGVREFWREEWVVDE